MQCKWCKKEFDTLQQKASHERLCKLNPNRKIINSVYTDKLKHGECSTWNKGLTSETDERNKKKFTYTFNGKEYNYLPDFIVDGKYVEIKGYWCEQWEAKYRQFPKNETLQVLTKNEIQPYINYVIDKHGKDFVSLYEKC